MNVSNFFSATLLITGVTIGAGILGLPYVFAPLGSVSAVIMILALGAVSLVLNLMIGEVAYALKKPRQLPGLAREILGPRAQRVLSAVIICAWLGSLLAYIVGEGEVLSALFGGLPLWWSCGFWLIGSACVAVGFGTVTRVVRAAGLCAVALFVAVSVYAFGRYEPLIIPAAPGWNSFVLAFGAVLFALHGTPAIAEAHQLLGSDRRGFRRVLIAGTIVPVAVYIVFTLASLGVAGDSMTPVAAIALGARLGPVTALVGSVGALIAMFTCYVGIATALRETLSWDSRLPPWAALLFPLVIPIMLFLFGARDFSRIIGMVGGVFLAIEACIMIAVYVVALKKGLVRESGFLLRHPWIIAVPVMAVFVFGAAASLLIR